MINIKNSSSINLVYIKKVSKNEEELMMNLIIFEFRKWLIIILPKTKLYIRLYAIL